MLDLYAGTFEGRRLRRDEFVVSADEMPSTSGITPFAQLVAQVMGQEPYASARRVFWIVDNSSSHNGWAAADRLRADWPRALLVHTPIHASWLNQVEIYLSIVKRKALTPRDFVDLADAEDRLHRFEWYYEASAAPFEWKFTRADLAVLLRRLAARQSLQPAA